MARKNSLDTVTNLLKMEIESNRKAAIEMALKYDYSNALVAHINANVYSRALAMIDACKPKGKTDGTEN